MEQCLYCCSHNKSHCQSSPSSSGLLPLFHYVLHICNKQKMSNMLRHLFCSYDFPCKDRKKLKMCLCHWKCYVLGFSVLTFFTLDSNGSYFCVKVPSVVCYNAINSVTTILQAGEYLNFKMDTNYAYIYEHLYYAIHAERQTQYTMYRQTTKEHLKVDICFK